MIRPGRGLVAYLACMDNESDGADGFEAGGDGFRYLSRSVAAGIRDPLRPLTLYFAEAGCPPGFWLGTGVDGQLRPTDTGGRGREGGGGLAGLNRDWPRSAARHAIAGWPIHTTCGNRSYV